jgi:hypothetical protein
MSAALVGATPLAAGVRHSLEELVGVKEARDRVHVP